VLLWITNIPTPYRVPLWEALRDRTRLQVVCMAATEPNRDWAGGQLLTQASAVNLHAPGVRLSSEAVLYLPTLKLIRLARAKGATVLIDGWESPAYLAAAVAARLATNPLIFFYRGTLRSHQHSTGLVARARAAVLRQADAVLTGGAASTEAVLSMGVGRDHIVEGINAVDVAGMASAKGRRPSDVASGHRYVVVGQLVQRKNVPNIIDAFAEIYAFGDTLTIIGDGPEAAALRSRAYRHGLDEAIRFAGHLDGPQLAAAYADADTLVLGSTREVYGLVVPEALVLGLHAVVSDATGVAETVRGMPGVFVCSPQVHSLADAMSTSRTRWRGPIEEPLLAGMTSEAAADRVVAAVRLARSNRGRP
jgi:glycosyltransferase involved in cell wall biosynthesis